MRQFNQGVFGTKSFGWAAAVFMVIVGTTAMSASDPQHDPATQSVDYGNELLIQLAVSDLDRSMKFYGETLGLKLNVHQPELEWAKYDTNIPNVRIGIGRQDTVTGSGTVSINISVRDVATARALLESRGVSFPKPSVNIPGVVKLADFTDPDGNRLRLAGPPEKNVDERSGE